MFGGMEHRTVAQVGGRPTSDMRPQMVRGRQELRKKWIMLALKIYYT